MTILYWILAAIGMGFFATWATGMTSLAVATEDQKLKRALTTVAWFMMTLVMFGAIGLGKVLGV